ncbi:hypothetical protein [Sphingobium nicotianae]|uniref:Glycosyltransferase RgtA/B/C/D-like domain-containing protein n=1 Tax=Sphingobium nicotianae TaxID=2782607 RepID=A0A9X1DDN0_9SPHN|nr:hypothetical protein [Sphingobium nicotianae]MBT2188126.1 hypothetical protein [Sphingobium nicotianae]
MSSNAWLAAIIAAGIALRVAAATLLALPIESDALGYFTMATNLAEHGILLDHFDQHIFYSAGYPLLLAPVFALSGASFRVAFAVNMLLCAATICLIHRLTVRLSGSNPAGLLAAAAFAVWLPAIWNASMLAKENLSTPLLLALALCAIDLARNRAAPGTALLAGLLWGASILTGGSSLMTYLAVGIALIAVLRSGCGAARVIRAGIVFLAGTLLLLGPWLYAADQMVGRPILSSNPGFNLYLGNNPAATGWFISISDTPAGKGWEATRHRLGEAGTAQMLQDMAATWIRENPAQAAQLAARKLVYFWQPNLPDAADFAASRLIASVRIVEVAQYFVILGLGALAFFSRRIRGEDRLIMATIILCFWIVHAAAYIIMRYRDPVVALLIPMAAIPVASYGVSLGTLLRGRRTATQP